MDHPGHGKNCGCPHHHSSIATKSSAGAWSVLLPILACAVCPGCLATYAKLLSAVGIGVALTESQHLGLLLGCVGLSLAVGLREIRTTRRRGSFVVTLAGCTSLLAAHFLGEPSSLTWGGVALLFAGGVWGHLARYQGRRPPRGVADPVRSLGTQRAS